MGCLAIVSKDSFLVLFSKQLIFWMIGKNKEYSKTIGRLWTKLEEQWFKEREEKSPVDAKNTEKSQHTSNLERTVFITFPNSPESLLWSYIKINTDEISSEVMRFQMHNNDYFHKLSKKLL